MIAEAFLAIADGLPDAMLLVGADGVVVAGNRAAAALAKSEPAALAGRRLAELVDDPPARVGEQLRAWSRSGEPHAGALRWRSGDAGIVECRADGNRMSDGDGRALVLVRLRPTGDEPTGRQFLRLNATIERLARDIREQRVLGRERTQLLAREQAARAEAEAAQHRAEFLAEATAVLSASLEYDATLGELTRLVVPRLADLCAVDITDDDGTLQRVAVSDVDPAWEARIRDSRRRFGYSAAGPICTVLRTGLPELMSEVAEEHVDRMAAGPEQRALFRSLGITSALFVPLRLGAHTFGVMTWIVSQSARRYTTSDLHLAGEIAYRAAVAIHHARLYRESAAARAEAEASNRAKDDFLATLSHELRTPLNAILGWARMLRTRDLGSATVAQALEAIDRNATAQAQLIEDLLDISRIVSGKLRLDPRPTQLAPVIRAAIDAVRPAAERKGVQVRAVIPSDIGPVTGDAGRLQQVVWNLLTNAVKFTPRDGMVAVAAAAEPDAVRISVADSGMGIDPEVLPHVFERFRQADSSSTRQHGGLGLGLALVKHIVELHAGTVQAESEGRDKGAVFTVRLPRRPAESAPAVHDPAPGTRLPDPRRRLHGTTVLVVDDEPDARAVCATVLAHHGADVEAVESVQRAMERIDAVGPDVVLADLGMPGEDGFSLIRRLRADESERGRRALVVAVTAFVSVEDRLRVLASGFDAHVAKPFDPDELVAIIEALLNRS